MQPVGRRKVPIDSNLHCSYLFCTQSSGQQLLLTTKRLCMYVCMYVQGRVSPCTSTSYVVYCTSPVNFKQPPCPLAVTAPLAPPTREWRNHHPGGGIDNYILEREMSTILPRGPLGTRGSLTCSKSTTRVKRLKVPPGGLRSLNFSVLKNSNPRHSGHEVGTLPLDHGGRFKRLCK
jgi:hypothetical protein